MANAATQLAPEPLGLAPAAPRPRRLHPSDIKRLRDHWLDYEAAIGHRSNWNDALTGSHGWEDTHDERTAQATAEDRVTRTVLARMPTWAVAVLHLAYAPPKLTPPGCAVFGDLAHLVALTPPAERIATKLGMSTREALDSRLRAAHAADVVAGLRLAAEDLLCRAADEYRRARHPTAPTGGKP